MTKRQHIVNTRCQPLGEAGLAACQQIVAQKQAAKINEVFVDLFSASAIVQVAAAINDTNRAKLLALPIARVADISFKLCN